MRKISKWSGKDTRWWWHFFSLYICLAAACPATDSTYYYYYYCYINPKMCISGWWNERSQRHICQWEQINPTFSRIYLVYMHWVVCGQSPHSTYLLCLVVCAVGWYCWSSNCPNRLYLAKASYRWALNWWQWNDYHYADALNVANFVDSTAIYCRPIVMQRSALANFRLYCH